ncbi:MAG TPA: ATP-binding cassette domain-containing protein [Pseudonocardia sp.]|uniref:ABC transporter ATP-binding protein n=1 Tax=Pseudonocardia sp. TaxID=60912 RepID=UPI002B4AE7B4|nr:ATP-binding cassette domain-containing protein [Pseudonocardia sp.]HLU54803.1 ATP-binding cassette domain-containing protein [Pseudonocardia sp.]
MPEAEPALDVRGICIDYGPRKRRVRAVEDVSLTVAAGETVGLVGESGSGKTSIAMAVLGLVPISAGSIRVNGRAIDPRRRGSVVEAGAQAVFQSPYSSLDPALPVRAILAEAVAHLRLPRREVDARVRTVLDEVGLDARAAERYPREFSGGQRQRIAIARAMMVRPRLLICDEPTSALDLSVQAQVANLLVDLQERHGMSYLLISHDLALVHHLAARMYVMHRGRVVESGPAAEVYRSPKDPYTRALIDAAPLPDPAAQRRRRARAAALVEVQR